MKNIRKRADGRYEFRKKIDGKTYSVYGTNIKKLLKQVKNFKPTEKDRIKESKSFIDLYWAWYHRYKANIKSNKNYISVLNNYLNSITKEIDKISLEELQDFLNDITAHRMAAYCYFVIKGVFKRACEKDLIKKDISQFLDKPKNKGEKGSSFNPDEQKIILNNLKGCKIGREVLFYLLVGCRRSEAFSAKPDFERNYIFIDGTKSFNAKRYVKISDTYCNILKNDFKSMFKHKPGYYTKEFKKFIDTLKIENKTLHDLRHTYATNTYYLGADDKRRQYDLGHASIIMTNDIYTHFNPNITKKDILNLYKDLYPEF